MKQKILLVDDEQDILEFLGYNLIKEGYSVESCNNGKDAVIKAKDWQPDLILLDVMMPGMDGIETCEEIRKIAGLEDTIISFLTARGEDYTQIAGFDAGADDYITKPVRPKVLISRIKALLKRVSKQDSLAENELTEDNFATLIIDREKYIVYKNGKEIILPRKEFEIIALLSSKPGRVFTRDDIYNAVWGDSVIVGDRTIDVHIRKLREKIGDEFIRTIKGVGYKYKTE